MYKIFVEFENKHTRIKNYRLMYFFIPYIKKQSKMLAVYTSLIHIACVGIV